MAQQSPVIEKRKIKGLYPLIVPDSPKQIKQPSKEKLNYKTIFLSKLNRKDVNNPKKYDSVEHGKSSKNSEVLFRSRSLSDDRRNLQNSWVCPNDRQLMLRAKLRIGWSVKAELYEKYGCKPKPLSDTEQEIISAVIKRAETIDKQEQERIGCLVEKLDNMKKHALGTGTKQCVLCGDKFWFLGSSGTICHDCKKSVCNKCGIETICSKQKDPLWLCKICAETREMWKKSGAWFYKSMPKYVLPQKTTVFPNSFCIPEQDPMYRCVVGYTDSVKEDGSSSEDEIRTTISAPARFNSLPNRSTKTSPVSPNNTKSMFDRGNSSCLIPKVARVTISDNSLCITNKSKYHSDGLFLREESFESNSSRTQSSESGGSIPQIFVNYCDTESGFESNNRDLSESDKSSVTGSIINHCVNDENQDDESSSIDSVPKTVFSMGTINLSIQYDSNANSLHIKLRNSSGLKGTDINGLSDPFCKLNLLPVGAKSYRLRTRTVPKSVNPIFDESFTFYGVMDSDILTQSLHILILDDDKYGHEVLGEARFSLYKLKPPKFTKDLSLNLEKHIPGDLEDEVWGEGSGSNGQISLTLLYSTRKRALIVGIVRCYNLIPMDSNGYSDPFVKLWLKSSEGSSPKYKTSIKWKNLNPIYNEEFVIDTKITDLTKKSLVITVWDKDPGRSNDYLGCLELGCHSKGDRLRHWIDTIKYPDHKHEGMHNLSDTLIKN